MAQYFDIFPKINYAINNTGTYDKSYDIAVHILTRVGVIQSVLDKIFYYYDYELKDGDTPEIVAEKFYKDPEAHWLVLLTNNIHDPQYDWVLDYKSFNNFIISKYGSIENAQETVHHYEKIQKTVDVESIGNEESYTKYEIQYDEYLTLPSSIGSPISYTLPNGKVVDVYDFYRNIVYCYDWELEQNEKKRKIKLIKPEYYGSIKGQLNSIMDSVKNITKRPGIRSVT